MHGWDLAALLIGVFWLGGYVALLGRAMLESARIRREGRDVVLQAEQTLTLERDGGRTRIEMHLPPHDVRKPIGPPPKPADAWRSVTPPRA